MRAGFSFYKLFLSGRLESDKDVEKQRYESRARLLFSSFDNKLPGVSNSLPLPLMPPYHFYKKTLSHLLPKSQLVLELCAGTGEHSELFIDNSISYTATDISPSSLQIMQNVYSSRAEFKTLACDIESLPFTDNTFDMVACAGGLSYGDNVLVMRQILRVLKPGGYFVCVDSLNHNPIYRINRFLHYLRGQRTRSTLSRMPSFSLINDYSLILGEFECTYFGKFSWLLVPLSKFLGEALATDLSNFFDKVIPFRFLAFKFVMCGRKKPFT